MEKEDFVMKKRLIIIFILSGLAVWGFIYRYPWSVGISSRPMVCIGPHCGISQESVEDVMEYPTVELAFLVYITVL